MANRTKFTPKKRAEFLALLAETCNVTKAAEAVNISRRRMYELRAEDDKFAQQWDAAIDQATDTLEAEARRRALDGVDEPVFYQGQECGTVRKYSDTLMIFLLKGHRPEKYRERHEIMGKDGGPIENHFRVELVSAKDGKPEGGDDA